MGLLRASHPPGGNRPASANNLPAISGDGYTVAFLTGPVPRPLAFTGVGLDLYVTDMTPGLSRKNATIGADPRSGELRSVDKILRSADFLLPPTAGTWQSPRCARSSRCRALHPLASASERAAPNARESICRRPTGRKPWKGLPIGRWTVATPTGRCWTCLTLSGRRKTCRVRLLRHRICFVATPISRPDAFVATRLPRTPKRAPPQEGQGESGLVSGLIVEIDSRRSPDRVSALDL